MKKIDDMPLDEIEAEIKERGWEYFSWMSKTDAISGECAVRIYNTIPSSSGTVLPRMYVEIEFWDVTELDAARAALKFVRGKK